MYLHVATVKLSKTFLSMATSRLIRLFFLTVNGLIASLLVISISSFCASVFETHTGKLTPAAFKKGMQRSKLGMRKGSFF